MELVKTDRIEQTSLASINTEISRFNVEKKHNSRNLVLVFTCGLFKDIQSIMDSRMCAVLL